MFHGTVTPGQFKIQRTKKIVSIMKNLYSSKFNKANNLFKKLLLFLSVQNLVACHAITLTNYRFKWCSVVINVIFQYLFREYSLLHRYRKFYFKDF
jgi:hypothetical protein